MRIQILSDLHVEFDGNSIPLLASGAELVILAGDVAPVHIRRVGDTARRWGSAERTLCAPGTRQGGNASRCAIGPARAQWRLRPPAQGQTNSRERAHW